MTYFSHWKKLKYAILQMIEPPYVSNSNLEDVLLEHDSTLAICWFESNAMKLHR